MKRVNVFPDAIAFLITLCQVFIIFAIFAYDIWSVDFMRVPICIAGLIFLTFTINKIFKFYSGQAA